MSAKEDQNETIKRSKYDPIINEFLESGLEVAKLNINLDPHYLRTRLIKRIKVRGLSSKIHVFVRSKIPHLEKID
jgi:hypothetical protein